MQRTAPVFFLTRILFLLVFLCPVVYAAEVIELADTWIVGRINVDNEYRNQYCSMRARFKNGDDVVLARDIANINSIAIDVKKKTFQPGHPYDVTLNVGDVERVMTAIAPRKNILLINMAKDPEFYQAVAENAYLSLSFTDQKRTYSLAGSSDALDVLTECVAHLSVGKEFNTARAKSAPQQVVKKMVKQQVPLKKDMKLVPQTELKKKQTLLDLVMEKSKIMPHKNVIQFRDSERLISGYNWQDGPLRIRAESWSVARGLSMEQALQLQTEKASEACDGDFAHTTGAQRHEGKTNLTLFENACISDAINMGTAGVFIFTADEAVTVLFETSTNYFENALAARDTLYKTIHF